MPSNFYTANAPLPPVQTVCEVPSASAVPYEPHCLMAWEEMVRGMDETAGINKETARD
jgi:hypothetical protein